MKIKNVKYIYVLDSNGKPLMPTKRLGMVRRWLKSSQAHWYKNSRDTIQFNRPTAHHLQKNYTRLRFSRSFRYFSNYK